MFIHFNPWCVMRRNIPWSRGGMGDVEYITAFSKVIIPITKEFVPDLIFISGKVNCAVFHLRLCVWA